MKVFSLTAQQLIELSETPIPPETLELVKGASPDDAAQIGWSNCFQMFQAALKAEPPQ